MLKANPEPSSEDFPSKLQHVSLEIVSDMACQEAWDKYREYKTAIISRMVCAGNVKGKDTCQVNTVSRTLLTNLAQVPAKPLF